MVFEVCAGSNATEDQVSLGSFHRTATDLTIEVAGDGCQALVEDLGIDVGEYDVEPGEGRHMGDATAHLTGSDDADGSDDHISPSSGLTP